MGKYTKKGKITGDVAIMEIPQSSSYSGVRTRARTLSLQPNSDLSYLQLRNRRLEKKPPTPSAANQGGKHGGGNSRVRVKPGSDGSESISRSEKGEGYFGKIGKVVVVGRCDGGETEVFNNHDLGTEVSFGENNLDFDGRERSTTRESTPCSFIRDAETIGTPGSTTRPTFSNRQARDAQRSIPTTPEMDEFFAGFELDQQKQFIEKYNYDVMNDLPLPGRYEWVRVDNQEGS